MIQVIVNTEGLTRILGDLQKRSSNLRPALTQIAGDMMKATKDNFEQEGRPRWPELAASTKKAKAKAGKEKMLHVSSGLKNSISSQVTDNSAIVGTNKEYAGIHQFGGTITQHPRSNLFVQNRYARGAKKGQFKKGTKAGQGSTSGERVIDIPERPFLKLTKEDIASAEKRLKDHLLPG